MPGKFIPKGVNENNYLFYEDNIAGPVASGANFTTQLPADFPCKILLPLKVIGATVASGTTAGTRVWNLFPESAGIQVVSYDENTGILTCKNATGAGQSNLRVQVLFLAAGP